MIKIYQYDTIDSTNTEAKRLLQGTENNLASFCVPSVIVAKGQTAGRGRQGKSFFSPDGTGLYMSVVDRLSEYSADTSMLTVKISMAVADAISTCTGKKTGIKWVNDLYLAGRKVCGILTEAVWAEGIQYVIIGVGVNITTRDFPSEISDIAGCLGAEEFIAGEIIAKLRDKIAENIFAIKKGEYSDISKYRELSIVLENEIEYIKNGKAYNGVAVEISEQGALVVKKDDGEIDILESGEVCLKKWKSF